MSCKYCGISDTKIVRGFCSNPCKNFENDLLKEPTLIGEEGKDYIVCLWSGYKCKQINSQYIKGRWPEKTLEDYRKEFPESPLQCGNMIKEATKNSGVRMKEDKYREMFSEKFKGENNPNHKSKTTQEERKKRSPFSKEFYKKENPNLSEDELDELVSDFAKLAIKDRLIPNQIGYWLERNFTEEESKKLVKHRQTTFTLESCIERHGEAKGIEIYNLRQIEWLKKIRKSFEENGDGRSIQSKWAKDIIISLCHKLDIEVPKKEKWISNGQFSYSYDFTVGKKIIEFNGDFWHCNPSIYQENYIHPITKLEANKIWLMYSIKIDIAKSYGYEVLVIWEKDWNNNPEEIINKCLVFLNS